MVKRDKNGKIIIKVVKKKNPSENNTESIQLEDPRQQLLNRVEFMQQQINQAYERINLELEHAHNGAGGSGTNNPNQHDGLDNLTEEELEEKIEALNAEVYRLTTRLDTMKTDRLTNKKSTKTKSNKKPRKTNIQASSKPPEDPSDPSSSEEDSSDGEDSDQDTDTEDERTDFSLPHAKDPVKVNITGGNLVGASTSNKLKRQIWQHKYIDFTDLLPNDDPSKYSLDFKPNSRKPSLQFIRKQKKIINSSEWINAWDEYMTIFAQKYPKHITHMMTYAKTIRSMMAANYNWLMYDEAFRRRRETATNQQDPASWTELKLDLYLQAMMRNNSFRENRNDGAGYQFRSQPSKYYVPPGYCYAYHDRMQYCPNTDCSYHHYCPNKLCNRDHPVYMCKRNKGNNNQGYTNQFQGRGNQFQGRSNQYQGGGNLYQGRINQNQGRGNQNFSFTRANARGNQQINTRKQRNSRKTPSPDTHQGQ